MQVLASKGFRIIVLVPKGSSRMLPSSRREGERDFSFPLPLYSVFFFFFFFLDVSPEGWTYWPSVLMFLLLPVY